MNSTHYAISKLSKELKDLQEKDTPFSVGLKDENDLFNWTVFFEGPEDTIYEGGMFNCELNFPTNYPTDPPIMYFRTEVWHPNSIIKSI